MHNLLHCPRRGVDRDKRFRCALHADRPTPLSMPAFSWKLSDAQIAAVASYVRNSWGNAAPAVTADQVKDLREKIHAKPE
jgi:mono/diheme cytochrome c family protein